MRAQWRVLVERRDFRRLFGGNSVSLLGSSVTTVALPLTAVVVLGASPLEMGVLGAVSFLPHLVLGLPAGVWVERWSYRRVMVAADLLAAAALAAVPVLAVSGLLRMWVLYVVVVVTGACGLFSTVAGQAFAPSLVPREELLAANSVLALSNSVVATSGSAVGGVLVQLLTAPVAIAVDAGTFVLSAIAKARISVAGAGTAQEPMLRGIWRGVRAAFEEPALRATTIAATVGALAGQMQVVVVVLFLVRELRLSAGLVGVVIAAAGAAGIVGAAVGVQITKWLGNGPAFIAGMTLSSLGGLVMAAAGGPVVVIVAQVLRGWGPTLYGINQQTIRQLLVAPDLLARTQATWRFLVYGMQPIGALLGGTLAAVVGFRTTLVISSLVMLAGTSVALFSPLRTLRQLPEA